jgi:hypothetical protein
MISIIQLLTAIAGIISLLLSRPKDKYDDIQDGRKDVIDGDVDAVNERIDRLLVKGRDSARKSGDIDTAQRISTLLGKNVVPK